MIAIAMLIAGNGLALLAARAQQPGTKRTDLQRHDLSAPGREVVQVRVDFDPEYVAPKHTHPGEEVVYVLEGTLEYQISGEVRVLTAMRQVMDTTNSALTGRHQPAAREESHLFWF